MDALQLRQTITTLLGQINQAEVISELNPRFIRVSETFASKLPSKDAAQQVFKFVLTYIEDTPKMLEVLDKLGQQYKMEDLLQPYIQVAANYLNSACQELEQESDTSVEQSIDSLKHLLTLLQGSYIFHRMIEELDDRIQNFIGVPLTHLDMMQANIIVHEVIGDNFANRLDQLIESMFQQSKITKAIIEAQLDGSQVALFRSAGKALSGESVTNIAALHGLDMF